MKILLVEALKQPLVCRSYTALDWDVLVPQGRATGLLGTLCLLLEQQGLGEDVPPAVMRHLRSALRTHRKQCDNLEYEVSWLKKAMSDIDERLIILKGSAYILGGIPAGSGRLVSDIDLLVPSASLPGAEAVLNNYGWESADEGGYNERYYRRWMHEIPPMAHVERDSVLDVHHTILPPTADEKLDPARLFDSLWEIRPGVFALSPLDMVLHSATHLFHEGEFGHGLRDLFDLDRLLRDFAGKEDDFWQRLVLRAGEMDTLTSLYYALRYSRQFFETPVPDAALAAIEAARPRLSTTRVMDFLFGRAFLPEHSSCHLPFTSFARLCLYVRSHYLRMPLYLLLPHLVRKGWMRVVGGLGAAAEQGLDPVGEGESA